MIYQLRLLVKNGGNCVNLGRHIKTTDPALYDWVTLSTRFLSETCKFNERVYCLMNDIKAPQFDAFGNPARFINLFYGYSLKNHLHDKIQRGKKSKDKSPKVRAPKRTLTPIEIFIKRNRKRNARLYSDDCMEGYDYIVCPVSKERMSMIKSSYINKILNLTVEEFDELYPSTKRICDARMDNIKRGLQEIDPKTNLTKHQLAVHRSKISLSRVDSNGLSGYDRKGQKTRATHMNNINELGMNGYAQLATKAIIKGNKTKAAKGMITFDKHRDEFKRYKLIVIYLTNKHRTSVASGYKTGLAGTSDAYHLDHIYSIFEGYKNKVSPFIIGSIFNLRMLNWEDNISKHSKSDIDLLDLLAKCSYTIETSIDEFDKIMGLIRTDIKEGLPPNAGFLLERFYASKLC
jgi:hypothetical protein